MKVEDFTSGPLWAKLADSIGMRAVSFPVREMTKLEFIPLTSAEARALDASRSS